ncbi:MAG: 16S rRNA (guanine(966)-N(2))-methyltransferase RsmD [Epsilonproteobacteria bacterium]|nr:MAG: 16S rRNA (guanine(966)-N(2))-methyltransferase RsmD [Campylobacterota bacterium]
MKQLTTNIVAGKYKNTKLKLPKLETTRSSKAILKESFFNTLQYDIVDKIFVECFAGSGSVGLEAISRGAKKGYFIELNKHSFNILQNNCQIDDKKTICIHGDSFEKTPRLLLNIDIESQIILYIDPPFEKASAGIYQKTFDMIELISIQNIYLIAFEYETGFDIPKTIGKFKLNKTKKFGRSSLGYYV